MRNNCPENLGRLIVSDRLLVRYGCSLCSQPADEALQQAAKVPDRQMNLVIDSSIPVTQDIRVGQQ